MTYAFIVNIEEMMEVGIGKFYINFIEVSYREMSTNHECTFEWIFTK